MVMMVLTKAQIVKKKWNVKEPFVFYLQNNFWIYEGYDCNFTTLRLEQNHIHFTTLILSRVYK